MHWKGLLGRMRTARCKGRGPYDLAPGTVLTQKLSKDLLGLAQALVHSKDTVQRVLH